MNLPAQPIRPAQRIDPAEREFWLAIRRMLLAVAGVIAKRYDIETDERYKVVIDT